MQEWEKAEAADPEAAAQYWANTFWYWAALGGAIVLFGGGWWSLIGFVPAVLCMVRSISYSAKT